MNLPSDFDRPDLRRKMDNCPYVLVDVIRGTTLRAGDAVTARNVPGETPFLEKGVVLRAVLCGFIVMTGDACLLDRTGCWWAVSPEACTLEVS